MVNLIVNTDSRYKDKPESENKPLNKIETKDRTLKDKKFIKLGV